MQFMSMNLLASFLVLFLSWPNSSSTMSLGPKFDTRIVLLLYDGFRWDFIERYDLHSFRRIRDEGLSSKGLRPSFPTEMLPNFATIVTGLYPEYHGLTANNMYDPVFRQAFNNAFHNPKWFSSFYPIWLLEDKTASQKGSNSTMLHEPTFEDKLYAKSLVGFHWLPSHQKLKPSKRLSRVLQLLQEEKSLKIIVCHFRQPGISGLYHGPGSKQVKRALRRLDLQLGHFLRNLKRNNLSEKVNIVIAGTHGLSEVGNKSIVELNRYLGNSSYHTYGNGVSLNVWPNHESEESIYEAIKSIPHSKHYKKQQIPGRLQYRENRRIAPLLLVADPGWRFVKNLKHHKRHLLGAAGYDNKEKDMHTIFIAKGPGFKPGSKTDVIDNIHVYPLLCDVLGLTGRPNNGSLGFTVQFQDISSTKPKNVKITPFIFSSLFVIVFSLIAMGCILLCRKPRIKYKKLNQEEFALVVDKDVGG